MPDMTGRTLKHYKIESTLGQGGMGIVYRARDIRLDRPVALKMLTPASVADPERRTRFLREARSAAALTHPSIAQIYDIDEAEGTIFIAMEFVDGKTVGRLVTERELDLVGAVEITYQVAEGLARAHEAGIIHRDIKSDNIMVTPDGHAKLLDFGLAKLLAPSEEEAAPPGDLSRTLTKPGPPTMPGLVMGTINYMSPEQARGLPLDPRSDIFSLGVVFYEMLTGERPFKGDTPIDTMHSIAYEEARPVTIMRRNLPPEVHRIVSRCLRKRREDRYPDARALAADLKRLKQDLESGTQGTLPAGERFRQWLERVKSAVPLGSGGVAILAAAVLVSIALLVVRINWGGLIGPAIIAIMFYRIARSRRRRLLAGFARKIGKLPAVRAVIVREDRVIVVVDKAQASVYLRVTSLIEEINRKLFFGKHVEAEVRDEVADEEFRNLLRQTGVLFVRDDAPPGPAEGGSPRG